MTETMSFEILCVIGLKRHLVQRPVLARAAFEGTLVACQCAPMFRSVAFAFVLLVATCPSSMGALPSLKDDTTSLTQESQLPGKQICTLHMLK